MKYELNPDSEYARKKKKMIKQNNGYCIGVPKTEEWRCPCKQFREKQESGYCGEGLYYKIVEELKEDTNVQI